MRLSLVTVLSADKLRLPGLLYEPEKPTTRAAVWLHGMGDNGVFYNPDRMNILGEQLAAQGIALLAFNNRGAHNRKRLKVADETLPEEDRSYLGGTHYELIADSTHDIDGAAAFLQARNYTELFLIGHSTGANKIVHFASQQPQNPFSKYVLAGPGDDTGLFRNELGKKRYEQAQAYAQNATASGDHLKTMPRYTGMYPFSAQSALDILHPDGNYNTFPFYEVTTERLGSKPLFQEYAAITKPMLVLIGEHDEFQYTAGDAEGALKILLNHTNQKALGSSDFQVIPNADHSFHGAETEFAEAIARWL